MIAWILLIIGVVFVIRTFTNAQSSSFGPWPDFTSLFIGVVILVGTIGYLIGGAGR